MFTIVEMHNIPVKVNLANKSLAEHILLLLWRRENRAGVSWRIWRTSRAWSYSAPSRSRAFISALNQGAAVFLESSIHHGDARESHSAPDPGHPAGTRGPGQKETRISCTLVKY